MARITKFSDSGRVFITGAGLSHFAGFPTGSHLYPFLIDHSDIHRPPLEWLEAYFCSQPKSEREAAISDLELFLTKCEMMAVPTFSPGGGAFWPFAPDVPDHKERFLAMLKHLRQNFHGRRSDVEAYYEKVRRRQWLARLEWSRGSLDSFVGTIVQAFLFHHSCVLYGDEHFNRIPNSQFLPKPEYYCSWKRWRCPCVTPYDLSSLARLARRVAAAFRRGDSIVTFNWDALLEGILWTAGKWTLADGYGVSVRLEDQLIKELQSDQLRKIQSHSPIAILKPHGSINWVKRSKEATAGGGAERLGLRFLGLLFDLPIHSTYTRPSSRERYDPEETGESILLAPTYLKDYSADAILQEVWQKIISVIERAREITVICYSLPKGDLSARALLAYAFRRNKLCKVVKVIDPRNLADGSWREFLAVAGKSAKAECQTFEDWVKVQAASASGRED